MISDRIKVLFFCLLLIVSESGWSKSLFTQSIKTAPYIDGWVMPAEWAVSDSAVDFYQLEPFSGQAASEKTVVYMAYDETTVFVAFKCYATSNEIVANIRARDALEKSDDHVFIVLDTYHDKRSAFVFAVSPLGTQADLRVVDDGRNLDTRWDAEWQAAAQRTDFGWSVEMAIPFASLKYNQDLTTWGLNIGRVIRAHSETAYWSGRMNDDFRISQGGTLDGIVTPAKYRPFKFVPYATVRHNDSSPKMESDGVRTEFGGDLFYNVTPSLTANLTYNPDFATVEGDRYQINLTRWELSFPEKRLFFLEGQELYQTRIQNFYSRRIGDIEYGGKMVGKIDKYSMAVLAAQSSEDVQADQPQARWAFGRVKRDILKSSSIGITAIDKSWDGGNTGSISADYVLNLGRSWKLTGQWVSSWPNTDDLLKHSAWFVRFARESNIYHYHVRYSDTGENFRDNVNQTGFIRDDDMREIDSDVIYRWWMKDSPIKYLYVLSKNNIFWNHAGTLRSWYVTQSVRMYLHNRLSLDVLYNDEFKLYEKKFYNHRYQLALGYNTDEWQSVETGYSWGHNYDRNFQLFEAIAKYRPNENIALHYSFKDLRYVSDSNASTRLNIVTVDYNFTRDLWCRVLAQHNTREDQYYIYGQFGWRFQPPFGAVYLVYTVDEHQPLDAQFKNQARVLFLKLSYQF